MRKAYCGHESRAAWNVSLNLSNDQDMYESIIGGLKHYARKRSKSAAVSAVAADLFADLDGQRTCDGVKYSYRTVWLAVKEMVEGSGIEFAKR